MPRRRAPRRTSRKARAIRCAGLTTFLPRTKTSSTARSTTSTKFSGALARNAERLDKIVEGMQSLAGGADGKGGEIVEAARSIRTLADNLDKRTDDIAKGVSLLTAAGTKQINAIGSDAHRMMAEIEKSVKNIERNPSTLIFGGSAAPKPKP